MFKLQLIINFLKTKQCLIFFNNNFANATHITEENIHFFGWGGLNSKNTASHTRI